MTCHNDYQSLTAPNKSFSIKTFMYIDRQNGNSRMEFLLCFSVGAILGDIFFHLIPESLETHLVELDDTLEIAQRKVGFSIIAGIFMFIIVEMLLEKWSNTENSCSEKVSESSKSIKSPNTILSSKNNTDLKKIPPSLLSENVAENNNNIIMECNECLYDRNGNKITKDTCSEKSKSIAPDQYLVSRKRVASVNEASKSPEKIPSSTNSNSSQAIDPAGYLSLIANGFDNFTHGLAIGASFLVGMKVGLLTTFVIFIHEIPHEICDYAILVNSGFSRWDAVKAQSSVSLFGIMGTAIALYVKSIDTLNAKTVWILPFSAGGFLHIALVNLLPELLERRTNFRDTIEQIALVMIGIAFMGAVALL